LTQITISQIWTINESYFKLWVDEREVNLVFFKCEVNLVSAIYRGPHELRSQPEMKNEFFPAPCSLFSHQFDGDKTMTQILQEKRPLNLAWMTGWCVAVGLVGLMIAGSGFEATSGPIQMVFDVLNGPGELELNPHMRFSLAVLGAVTIGWSVTLMAAIQAANQLETHVSQPIWALITAAIVTWYIIDSSLSIATGFWLNAVSNTIISAAFLIPITRSGLLRA
jgi:hypothetical protein